MITTPSRIIILATIVSIFSTLIIIEFIIAKYNNKTLYNYKDSLANLQILIIRNILNTAITGSVMLLILQFIYNHGINLVGNLNKYTYWIILIIAQDFLYYWFHRFSHVCRLGWASHVVHHSSTYFNYTTAIRESVTYVASGIWIFWLPLALIGYTPTHILVAVVINLLYQFFLHTQLINKLGIIELIFNTPSHHRVHHGRNPQYINRNYAGILIIWDKLFGTFTKEQQTPEYGITTPMSSFNPLVILFHEWQQMILDIVKSRNIKYLVVFKKK